MPLISDELREALNSQWSEEVYNSHLYLFVYAYLKNKGFDNIASHFKGQHGEEQTHAQMILDLLTDLNADFDSPAIEPCRMSFNSILDVASAYIEREIGTTTSLNEIKQMAIDENNPVIEERMREMIKLQQHEYEEATGFMDKAQILGGDWKATLLWDAALGD